MINAGLDILVVDDDDLTVEMVERSVARITAGNSALRFCFHAANDGTQALEMLRDNSVNRPNIILLDLNMPRMNGFEFLDEIRKDRKLSDSVIFVITTSDSDYDRVRAYREHVAGYIVKSFVGPQFNRVANLISTYNSAIRLPE